MNKVSIHIDGGYFLKRLPDIRPDLNTDFSKVAGALNLLVTRHLQKLNETYREQNEDALLYRVFYYDARPFADAQKSPIDNRRINFSQTSEAKFRNALFSELRKQQKFALRLGQVIKDSGWQISPEATKKLLRKEITIDHLVTRDVKIGLRQKGVDMRMGIDIASVAFKKQASTIILVTADSDFVPASKLARREGVEIILDPLWRTPKTDLYEHIDSLYNGLPFLKSEKNK
ncbi:MAG: NYN domain-containing protein [Robiginitomaculum sp.]|nr:NYN domain-containing protein [Robiginitomaculum sp.]